MRKCDFNKICYFSEITLMHSCSPVYLQNTSFEEHLWESASEFVML